MFLWFYFLLILRGNQFLFSIFPFSTLLKSSFLRYSLSLVHAIVFLLISVCSNSSQIFLLCLSSSLLSIVLSALTVIGITVANIFLSFIFSSMACLRIYRVFCKSLIVHRGLLTTDNSCGSFPLTPERVKNLLYFGNLSHNLAVLIAFEGNELHWTVRCQAHLIPPDCYIVGTLIIREAQMGPKLWIPRSCLKL